MIEKNKSRPVLVALICVGVLSIVIMNHKAIAACVRPLMKRVTKYLTVRLYAADACITRMLQINNDDIDNNVRLPKYPINGLVTAAPINSVIPKRARLENISACKSSK